MAADEHTVKHFVRLIAVILLQDNISVLQQASDWCHFLEKKWPKKTADFR